MAIDLKRDVKIGLGIGIISWLLGLFYKSVFGGGGQIQASLDLPLITEGFKQQIQGGINIDLASKIIGYLNGLPQVNIMGLLTLGLGGILIVIIGDFVVDKLKNMGFMKVLIKTPIRKLVTIAVVGTFLSGLVVAVWSANVTPQLPVLSTVIAMVLYFLVVAILYSGLARISKGTAAKQIFIEI